jgi:hypothetical protein
VDIDSSIKHLFAGDELAEFLDRFFSKEAVEKKVREFSKERFTVASDEELAQYFVAMLSLSPLELLETESYTDEYRDSQVAANHFPSAIVFHGRGRAGFQFNLFIPYVGLRELWLMKPSSVAEYHCYARINEAEGGGAGTLEIPLAHAHDAEPEAILEQRERFVAPIREILAAQAAQIQVVMNDMPGRIASAIADRRSLHEVARRVQEVLAIPVLRRDGAPDPFPVPLERKIPPPLPGQTPARFGLRPPDFEYVLQVLRHVGATFERTPRTYRVHNEEELRDIVIANLNGHLIKSATAEAFSVAGKTDILVEFEGKAAFIAECKIWEGTKQLERAVRQLFGYTTWQDCRISVVVFNKHVRAFSKVMSRIRAAIKSSFNIKRQETTQRVNEWRFVIASPQHADAEVVVHVFAFDVFWTKGKSRRTKRQPSHHE